MTETNTIAITDTTGFKTETWNPTARLYPSARKQRIIRGFEKEIIEVLIKLEILFMILWHVRSPRQWPGVIKALDPHRKHILGERRIKKLAKVDGRYYWGLFLPGWPSAIFHQFIKTEIGRAAHLPIKTNRFSNIFMAVTNKCPLACEHCYEWDALNKGERLTVAHLNAIVRKSQEAGVSQIHLSGGEPLVRINDVIEVITGARKVSEFWMLTSGFKLTYEKASRLKKAGLTGLLISVDHFDPEEHNKFRGHKVSFQWVEEAVRNALAAKLVTALSICVTKDFISESNLANYMEMAKDLGVSFVQFLEPRATGHYAGMEVELTMEQEHLLEETYLKFNYQKEYRQYPPVSYHGFHQRRMGCLAAGDKSLYIDTVGDIHACPFCQRKAGNILTDNLEDAIGNLQQRGCHKFNLQPKASETGPTVH